MRGFSHCHAPTREYVRAMRMPGMSIRFMLAIAVGVAGCASNPPAPLSTGNDPDGMAFNGACYTNFASGTLIADPVYGTRIQDLTAMTEPAPIVPIMWPVGYTARHSGSEIEVLNGVGAVVAKTGNRYQIEGGYVGGDAPAFLACGYVLPK